MLDVRAIMNGENGAVMSVLPLLRTADVDGSSADLQGYEGAVIELLCGTVTDGTHTVVIEESDDNSTWSAVADADLDASEPAYTSSNEEKCNALVYLGDKRYLRVTIVVTGSPATGATIGAKIQRTFPRRHNAI